LSRNIADGDWIGTHSGGKFWPLDPDPNDVNIGDIAHALSQQCRYTGHTHRPYSVAEHSLLVSAHCPSGYELEGLLHDAAEAYLADVARPVKHRIAGLVEVEDRIHQAVCTKYNLPFPISPQVKDIDNRILSDEREALFPRHNASEWFSGWGEPRKLGVDIECLPPYAAETRFIMEFYRLTERGVASG
jgi:uncharacterized protein